MTHLTSYPAARVATAVVSMTAFSAVFFELTAASVLAVALLCLLTLSAVLWVSGRTRRSITAAIAAVEAQPRPLLATAVDGAAALPRPAVAPAVHRAHDGRAQRRREVRWASSRQAPFA